MSDSEVRAMLFWFCGLVIWVCGVGLWVFGVFGCRL